MSSINPNNIDGTYPIAGQDNDSQGFRDNFTNIKNNFTFSKTEIEDLQNNAILKTALAGTTLDNNLNNAQLYGAQIRKFTETYEDLGTQVGSVPISWNDAHFQSLEITGNTTISLSGWPTSQFWTYLVLDVTPTLNNLALTLPAEVSVNASDIQGFSGGAITLPQANVTYRFEFSTYNGGTDIAIRDLFRNYDAAIDFTTLNATTVNATGNVLATGLSVFGNARLGLAGVSGGQFHTVVGNITQTSSGGADTVYINTTGNVLAAAYSGGAVTVTGAITTSGTGGVGYAAGAGGTITQGSGSEKNTTVVLNKTTGTITLNGGICFANARVANAFTLTNSTIGNQDLVVIQHVNTGALGGYSFAANTATAGGSATISVRNHTQLDLSEAIVIRFAVIKSTDA